MLVDGLGDPLGIGVPPDGLVEGINQDHFKELVSGIFTHPIRVQDSQSATVTASTFLEEKKMQQPVRPWMQGICHAEGLPTQT